MNEYISLEVFLIQCKINIAVFALQVFGSVLVEQADKRDELQYLLDENLVGHCQLQIT